MGGKSSEQTIGYRYYLGVHFVPCLGPVDSVLRIDVADREAWIGNGTGGRITINKPNLFGGKKREGGISGAVDIAMGGPTQTPNSYLQARKGTSIPAFRGVLGVILRQCYLGNNPYLKPWAFKIQRVFTADDGEDQWEPETAGISRGIKFRNAAIYVAFDASASMAGTRWTGQIDALRGFLSAVRANRDADAPNDLMLARFSSTLADSVTYRDMVTSDYIAADDWLEGQADPVGGTNYEAAVSGAAAFFSGADADKDRVLIFLTDGLPTEGSLSAAVATLDGISGLDRYAFNIDLTDTSATAQIDNTPDDGVPVVTGGDPTSLIDAFARVFSLGFDMNPAHILREVLIARDTGGDGDDSVIGPSFETAAQTLFDEGFGLSFFWNDPTDKKSFIEAIEQHADLRLYQDRRTGLWEIKLIRDDYDVETLPVFDRTNVIEWSDIDWPDASTLPNQITVTYTDPNKDAPSSLTLTNPARVQMVGRIINEARSYEGIYSAALAAKVATRDLRALSLPLCSGVIRCRYVPADINLGSPIIVSNPRLGIDGIVARVIEIVDGDGRDNAVEIRFVEDQFSYGDDVLLTVTDSEPNDAVSNPQAATVRMVEELPYYEAVRRLSQSETDDRLAAEPDIGFIIATAQQPTDDAINMTASTDAGSGYEDGITVDFSPATVLRSDLSSRADHVFAVVDDTIDLTFVRIGSLAKIGTEYLRVDAITTPATWDAGDYWEPPVTPTGDTALITFGRACLDTAPRDHVAGDVVLFWGDFADADTTQYLATESVDVKLLTVTGRGVLPAGSAPVDTITFASRAIRPYPPGKLQADGSYAGAEWAGTVTLTWAHRDRQLQTTAIFDDHTVGDIGPEAGTTYTVRAVALDEAKDELATLYTATGLTGTTATVANADFTVAVPALTSWFRFEVYSLRDGYESWQRPRIDMANPTNFLLIASSDELDPAERELLSGDEQTDGNDKTLIIEA